ncbi:hypothetical protein FRB90_002965 [Tulasnella sp. 427]|nr:hypothetical protein FRB90_002965 [Tulasnella sp. 427]
MTVRPGRLPLKRLTFGSITDQRSFDYFRAPNNESLAVNVVRGAAWQTVLGLEGAGLRGARGLHHRLRWSRTSARTKSGRSSKSSERIGGPNGSGTTWRAFLHDEKERRKRTLLTAYPAMFTGPHGVTLKHGDWLPEYVLTVKIARNRLTTPYNTDLSICMVIWRHASGLYGLSFFNNHLDFDARLTSFRRRQID